MSVLVEFSMSPMDKGESVGEYVARCVEIVEDSGLPYQLTAMGTVVEGSWNECFHVVTKCHEALAKDCDRITTSIRADTREGPSGRIQQKVKSVEEHVGHEVAR